MQNQNKSFGLIGYPLGHSYSKSHFSRKFEREGLGNHSYLNFEIPSLELFDGIVKENPDLIGLNVTIPYKQAILSYLDDIDPIARIIGAVNTIKIIRSGNECYLTGYNTDAIGFEKSIGHWTLSHAVKAMVFGTGGSSLAIKYALSHMGIGYISVSRKAAKGVVPYEELTKQAAADHLLWVNCTPVGMFPDSQARLPLPYEVLTPAHYLYDLVYNPDITEFLRMGNEAGSSIMNGTRMLFEQAEASWEIWNNNLVNRH